MSKTALILLMSCAFSVVACGSVEEAETETTGEAKSELVTFTSLPPNDARISVRGAKWATASATEAEFLRMPESTLALSLNTLQASGVKARTTTGVQVLFRTAAPEAQLRFRVRSTDENRGSEFGVYVNNVWQKAVNFSSADATMTVPLTNTTGTAVNYKILLPSWSNPLLQGVDVQEGYDLITWTPPARKVYVALGDSITHGVGQGSASYKTWAWILNKQIGYDLYNLAVGGSKISTQINSLVGSFATIDVLTYLIGYNDWNAGKSTATYKSQLKSAVQNIRAAHPETKIFLIRQTYTKDAPTATNAAGATLDSYRNAVTQIVTELADPTIYLIRGDDIITSDSQLNDTVHPNTTGAQNMADGMYTRMAPLL